MDVYIKDMAAGAIQMGKGNETDEGCVGESIILLNITATKTVKQKVSKIWKWWHVQKIWGNAMICR